MRRPPRELAAFSLSALDVLAMSTGVFVLLLVMMIPYYRKTLDAEARLQQLQTAIAAVKAEAADATARAAAVAADAATVAGEVARLNAAAQTLEQRAARDRAAADQAMRPPVVKPQPPRPLPPTAKSRSVPALGTPVAKELDLVFVIDRTASMTPAIGELSLDLASIVRVLERMVPSLRVGIVAYSDRDTGQNPITILPLTDTASLPRILQFVEGLRASSISSPTPEEDVYLGLQAAISLAFRPTALQSLVLIGDAAAHPDEVAPALQLVRAFIARAPLPGKRTVSALFVTTPGSLLRGQMDASFFRDVAAAGGGPFTEHAGSMIDSVLASVLVD